MVIHSKIICAYEPVCLTLKIMALNWWYGSELAEADRKITIGVMGFWTMLHFHKTLLIVLLEEAAVFQLF